MPARPRVQINSRRSRTGPAWQDPIGSAGIVRHGEKRAPGPRARQNQPPKISRRPSSHPSEQPPPATPRPLSSSPSPPSDQKSSPALPRRRLARFPLPTPRVPVAHSQATPHSARKVFVHLPVPEGAPRLPRGGPLIPARNRAGTKGLAFSPASGVPVGIPGLKALTGWD
jgi:hypothetical protein